MGGMQPDGLPTFADGYRAAVLTEAVVESARSQAWVEAPEGTRPTSRALLSTPEKEEAHAR